MNAKRMIWLGAVVGGWLGGYVPLVWGAHYFSLSGIVFSCLGAIVGIWIVFKLTH